MRASKWHCLVQFINTTWRCNDCGNHQSNGGHGFCYIETISTGSNHSTSFIWGSSGSMCNSEGDEKDRCWCTIWSQWRTHWAWRTINILPTARRDGMEPISKYNHIHAVDRIELGSRSFFDASTWTLPKVHLQSCPRHILSLQLYICSKENNE